MRDEEPWAIAYADESLAPLEESTIRQIAFDYCIDLHNTLKLNLK